MDPNACIDLMLSASCYADAREHYLDLRTWIYRGGFKPKCFESPYVSEAFLKGTSAFTRAVLRWSNEQHLQEEKST